MPSNKSPSVVRPGTGLPTATSAAALAIGEALKAHIDDPVGAHAGSAISYTAGPDWADSTTNPDADVQAQLDKIIGDLSTLVGQGGIARLGSGNYSSSQGPWALTASDFSIQVTQLLDGVNFAWYQATVNAGNSPYTLDATAGIIFVDSATGARQIILPDPALFPGFRWYIYDATGNSSLNKITINAGPYTLNSGSGTFAVGQNWGQWIITCNGTQFFLQEVEVENFAVYVTTPTYTITSNGRLDPIFVDTSAIRTINLPTPSTSKGWGWRLIDIAGNSETNNITIAAPGGGNINGIAGSFTAAKNWGQWVITCNGTNFMIQEVAPPVGPPVVVAGAAYLLDSSGYQDEEVFVNTTTASRTINLPQFPANHKGQRWYIYDMTGTSENYNINITHTVGTYNINGNSSGLVVGSNYGKWVVTCDGFNYFVQVCKAPIGSPVYIPSLNTSPYQMEGRTGYQDEVIFVDTSAQRTIYLPLSPSQHKGQRWFVYDQTGTSETIGREILVQRNGGSFTINGFAGDTYLSANFGMWTITCDGTNYLIS